MSTAETKIYEGIPVSKNADTSEKMEHPSINTRGGVTKKKRKFEVRSQLVFYLQILDVPFDWQRKVCCIILPAVVMSESLKCSPQIIFQPAPSFKNRIKGQVHTRVLPVRPLGRIARLPQALQSCCTWLSFLWNCNRHKAGNLHSQFLAPGGHTF